MSLSIDTMVRSVKNEFSSQQLAQVSMERRKLVKLEVDYIPQSREKWAEILDDRTTDRELAENAINACYLYAGLDRARVLWTENPLTAMKILLDRPDLVDVGSSILHQICNSCDRQIDEQIAPEFIDVVKAYANPRATIVGEQHQMAFDPLGDFLNQVSICEIQKSHPHLDPMSLPTTLQDYRIAYLSYFDYFHQIGVEIPQIQLLIDLARSCGNCWAFENIAILTPKPAALEFNDRGELMALVYDGINILE
ncbi:hypothetical protein [Chamaesiphon sp. OTE_20_metabat_361]|uniref:hypothetical protein n=1 Tax=Chamaesiphon sp. OTE_20_metabat_361 TaxID=2964689 RepID=UPI00286B3717|nr:hypothetical protein [Chamaesiphon sp. OTE_20_metabat_361]